MEDFLVEPAELIELAETAMKEANYKEDYMSKIKKTWVGFTGLSQRA